MGCRRLFSDASSIEFRSKHPSPLWRAYWDVSFASFAALALFVMGAAVGLAMRGLPIASDGELRGGLSLLADPYALSVGGLAVAAGALHGANLPRAFVKNLYGQALGSSGVAIVSLVALFGVALFPRLARSSIDDAFSLTVYWVFCGRVKLDTTSYEFPTSILWCLMRGKRYPS